jgi:tetratricopeptide (TPR) repeat protein
MAQADLCLETESFRAREPAERAVAIARGLDDPVREGHALRRLGQEARYRYDHTESRNALEAAAASFRQAELPGEAAICLHLLSLTMGDQGNHAAALEAAEDALALSRAANDRRHEATSLRRLAIVYLNRLEHARALPFAEEALAIHRQLGDRSEECRALNVLGVITGWLGRPEEAEAYLFQSLELAEATGSSMSMRSAVINLLWSHFRWQGEYEAALTLLDEQLVKARLANDEILAGHLLSQRPLFLGMLGQYATALESVEVLLPRLERLVSPAIYARFLSFMGQMQAELGDLGQARQEMEAALGQAMETGTTTDTAFPLINLARLALLEGGQANLRLGLDQAQRASELLRGTASTDDLADALHTVSQLHLALHRHGAAQGGIEMGSAHAEAALRSSVEVMELIARWPSRPEAYLLTHSRALRAVGRETEADDHLHQAHERVMLVASKTRDASLRLGWLEGVRINREILTAQPTRKPPR